MSASDLNLISHDFLSFDNFWDFSVLNDEFNSPNSYYIVAKLQDKIVGFAGIKVMFDEADIMNIAVRKDFRNQGIGSLLLENLIHLTEELTNINFITLEVMDENYSAIHLYQKFNFEKCGIRKNYYKGKNAIIMKKRN